jgi:hypothetical protein
LRLCRMLLESLLTCSCACLDRSSDCDSAKGDLSDLNRRAWIQSFQQRFFWMWFGQVCPVIVIRLSFLLFNWFRFFWFLRLKNRPEPNKTGRFEPVLGSVRVILTRNSIFRFGWFFMLKPDRTGPWTPLLDRVNLIIHVCWHVLHV